MRLFEIDEHFQVQLNKEWIMMVPEFAELVKRDKGSEGDYRGSKKLKSRAELTYIYFMVDFHSPIRDYLDEKRHEEALRYARLKDADIDAKVNAALDQYKEMQYENAQSLRTLNSLKKGMIKMDKYFEDVDFDKLDSLKRQVYTVESYQNSIVKLPKMRTAIKEYERMVEEELRENTGIRGKAQMGGMEGKRRDKVWTEGGPPEDDLESKERESIEL
jgi:hypothetical protein